MTPEPRLREFVLSYTGLPLDGDIIAARIRCLEATDATFEGASDGPAEPVEVTP